MNTTNFVVLSKPGARDRINAPLYIAGNPGDGAVGAHKQPFQMLWANIRRLATIASPSFIGAKSRLIKHSAVYGWLKIGLNDIPVVRQKLLDWQLTRHVDFKGALTPEMYMERPGNPGDVLIENAAAYFAKLRDWINTNLKVPFAVMVVPGHHEINVERFQHWRQHAGLTKLEMDPYRPRKLFMRALRERGITVLDPLGLLHRQAPKPLIFPDDGHLNATGHRALTETAKGWLDKAGILPEAN